MGWFQDNPIGRTAAAVGTLGASEVYNYVDKKDYVQKGLNQVKGVLGLGKTDTSNLNPFMRTKEQIEAENMLLKQLAMQAQGQASPASAMAMNQAAALGAAQSSQSSNPFLGIKAAQQANIQNQAAAQLGNQQQLSDLITGQRDTAMKAAQAQNDANAADKKRRSDFLGNAGATAAKIYTGSDERMKKDVKKEGNASSKVEDFIMKLDPYTFQYKDNKEGEGSRMGVMAQDLEKSPIGNAAVVEVDGVKRVDPARLALPMLAAQAEMIKKIKELEDKVKKRKS